MFLIGAGGHGKVVAEIFELDGREFRVLDAHSEPGAELLRRPVESERLVFGKTESSSDFFVSIGDAADRRTVTGRWLTRGHSNVRAIHPTATVSAHARIGEGVCIMAGAIVQPEAVIERGVIVNTGAIVDHDCVVGEFAHVGPRVRLAGNVQVGAMTHVGLGARGPTYRCGIDRGSRLRCRH